MKKVERIKTKKFTWVHIQLPSVEIAKKLGKEFDLHPLIQEELPDPTFRTKVDTYENALYMVLHFPLFNKDSSQISPIHELDIVLGKNFLITAVYSDDWNPFSEFNNACNKNPSLKNKCFSKDAGSLLYNMLSYLYSFLLSELEHIGKKIEDIESRIFDGQERQMLEDILRVRRDILDFRQTIKPHSTILASLMNSVPPFVTAGIARMFSNVEGEYLKVWQIVENYKETIEALHDTNESLLSTKTNEIMKLLTIMAFITFPLTLVASIFGMNTKYLPIVGIPGDFWIITGAMFLGVFGIIFVFKFKKWI